MKNARPVKVFSENFILEIPLEYNTREEIDTALDSEKAVVVFSADWCGPCKTYAPTVAEFKEEVMFKPYYVDGGYSRDTLG